MAKENWGPDSGPGVYIIFNLLNDKFYIGSSQDMAKRWDSHLLDLRTNRHPNAHLQRAWNTYGEGRFICTTLEHCQSTNDCLPVEQKWLASFKATDEGYNISPTAGSPRGYKHSTEIRSMLSEMRRGVPKSEKHKQAMAQCRLGSSSHKAKLNEKQVLNIRRRLSNGETGRALAKEFNTTFKNISAIKLRKSWTHI